MNFEVFQMQFQSFLGASELIFDEEGICSLQIQDEFLLLLKWNEEEERLVITAEMETPAFLSQQLLAAVLTFNFQRMAHSGAWIGLDPKQKAFFLIDEFLLKAMKEEDVQQRLEQFFKHYLTFQGVFTESAVEMLLKSDVEGTRSPDQFA